MLALALPLFSSPSSAPKPITGDKYELSFSGTTSDLKAGKPGKLAFQFKAAKGYHISGDAPLKVKLDSSALKLSKKQLKSKDATVPKSEAPAFEVPVSGDKAGAAEVDFNASFFVCDVKICERKTAKVKLPFKVKP